MPDPDIEIAELRRLVKRAWRDHKILITLHIIWRLPLYAYWFVEAVIAGAWSELKRRP